MTNINFKAVREVYVNGKSRKTVKVYETYEQAKAYAKRYSKLTGKATFVNVSVYFNTDDYKYQNVDIYTIDSNEFEIEHLEQIEKFQRDVEEMVEPPQKTEKKYNFYITDYTEDRELPTFYEGYTKKEITNMVKEWSEKNNHVYKIYIYDRTSDKGIAGRVFFKVINWKQIYKVGKTGSRLRFGEFSYEEAEKYCKKYAEKDGIVYTIYEVKLDEYGRDDTVQVINIEPPEKPEPTPKIKTLQDWEKKGGNFTDFCKVGDKVDKGIVDYFVDVLPPITWRTDLVQCGEPYGHRDNPETGRWEATFITFSKNDKGQWYYAGICFKNQREAIA